VDGTLKQRKNKSVESSEHKRIEPLSDDGLEDNMEAKDGDTNSNQSNDDNGEELKGDDSEFNSDDSTDEEDCDENVIGGWVQAFGMAEEDMDDDDPDEEEGDENEDATMEQDDGECDGLKKLAYEVEDDNKDPWPDWKTWDRQEKYEKWPQENTKHLKKMKKQFGPVMCDRTSMNCQEWWRENLGSTGKIQKNGHRRILNSTRK